MHLVGHHHSPGYGFPRPRAADHPRWSRNAVRIDTSSLGGHRGQTIRETWTAGETNLFAACGRQAGSAQRRHTGLLFCRPSFGADAFKRGRYCHHLLCGHKLTSKIMVIPSIQKVADLRGKVLAVANPGSASDFAAKLFIARQGMKLGQDISLIYSGSTSAAFAALVNGRVQGIFATRRMIASCGCGV